MKKVPFRASVDEPAIKDVEEKLGVRLPDDYRNFLLERNGAYPVRRTFTFLTKNAQADEQIECLYGIQADHTDDLVKNQPRPKLPARVIAIGRDAERHPICMDCNPGPSFGVIFYKRNYKQTKSRASDLHRIAGSFSDLLSVLWDGHTQPNYRSEEYKLLYKDQLMGIIRGVGIDQPFFTGHIKTTPAYEAFRAGFEQLEDEDNSEHYLDEPTIDLMNWFVEDDNHIKHLASVGVQDKGTYICWRW